MTREKPATRPDKLYTKRDCKCDCNVWYEILLLKIEIWCSFFRFRIFKSGGKLRHNLECALEDENTTQHNTTTTQYNHNTTQHNTTQPQHNTTQPQHNHNTTTTQHSTTQHNTTQPHVRTSFFTPRKVTANFYSLL